MLNVNNSKDGRGHIIARIRDDKGLLPEKMFLWLDRESLDTDCPISVDIATDGHGLYNVFKEEGLSCSKISNLDFGIGRSIKLCNDLKFELLDTAEKNQTQRIFIIGKSGCGKSYWIGEYLERFQQMFPDKPIFMVSRKSSDEAFSKIKGLRYVNPELPEYVKRPLESTDFPNDCCVIFDDATCYPKDIQQNVNRLRADLLSLGRSRGISIISTSHQYKNYEETKIVWFECNFIIISRKSQQKISQDVLIEKLGLDKHVLKDIYNKIVGRLLIFHAEEPNMVIGEHECHILVD